VWSFSTVEPETPIAPMIVSPSLIGMPPGNVISPPLECSMLYSGPPGWLMALMVAFGQWWSR